MTKTSSCLLCPAIQIETQSYSDRTNKKQIKAENPHICVAKLLNKQLWQSICWQFSIDEVFMLAPSVWVWVNVAWSEVDYIYVWCPQTVNTLVYCHAYLLQQLLNNEWNATMDDHILPLFIGKRYKSHPSTSFFFFFFFTQAIFFYKAYP